MKICAVIPAAGKGTRLGAMTPKLLQPITKNDTVWSILRKKLFLFVDHINIIVSPYHYELFCEVLNNDIHSGLASISIQNNPIGMGDAIFCGEPIWSRAEILLTIWGDQLHVSSNTIRNSLNAHAAKPEMLVMPLTQINTPYVEYIFNQQGMLTKVLQSREGDICNKNGWSDVGTFVLSTRGLLEKWNNYLATTTPGKITHEINFLPFLPFLADNGWNIKKISVVNNDEARGINTKEDLLYFQSIYGELTS